jgi:hypothetical protein
MKEGNDGRQNKVVVTPSEEESSARPSAASHRGLMNRRLSVLASWSERGSRWRLPDRRSRPTSSRVSP